MTLRRGDRLDLTLEWQPTARTLRRLKAKDWRRVLRQSPNRSPPHRRSSRCAAKSLPF